MINVGEILKCNIMTHRIWHVQLNSQGLIAFNIKGHLVLKIDFEVLLSLLYKREGTNALGMENFQSELSCKPDKEIYVMKNVSKIENMDTW